MQFLVLPEEQFVLGDGCYLAGFKGQFPEAKLLSWASVDGLQLVAAKSQVPCGWEHIEPPLCGAVTWIVKNSVTVGGAAMGRMAERH